VADSRPLQTRLPFRFIFSSPLHFSRLPLYPAMGSEEPGLQHTLREKNAL